MPNETPEQRERRLARKRESQREYRLKNKDKVLESQREYNRKRKEHSEFLRNQEPQPGTSRDYQALDDTKFQEIISDLNDLPNIPYLNAKIDNHPYQDGVQVSDWSALEKNLNELDDLPNIPYLNPNLDEECDINSSATTPLSSLEKEVINELTDLLPDEALSKKGKLQACLFDAKEKSKQSNLLKGASTSRDQPYR